ncbi:MAG: hypothetical protein HUN04_17620 [Desulfobacter sp.]|nr:MAG: hypothetical protein HUN04_17620 [Desulfobacter sp.]
MVFFTSILVVVILYFLQADGLIYVTIIALAAELVNIFLTHTVAKSVEKKINKKNKTAIQKYASQLRAYSKNIKELEKIREDAGKKLYKANTKIKKLESRIKELTGEAPEPSEAPPSPNLEMPPPEQPEVEQAIPAPQAEDHLPAGSGRKAPPA